MSMHAKTLDVNSLTKIFEKYTGVQAVYLFGSSASGKTHVESDLDLAICPRDPTVRAKKLDILADLTRAGYCNVDLVFLDTDDIVLKFEAVRKNRPIYRANDFNTGEFFSLTLRQYFDFLPYLELQRKAYKQRVIHDGERRSHP